MLSLFIYSTGVILLFTRRKNENDCVSALVTREENGNYGVLCKFCARMHVSSNHHGATELPDELTNQ